MKKLCAWMMVMVLSISFVACKGKDEFASRKADFEQLKKITSMISDHGHLTEQVVELRNSGLDNDTIVKAIESLYNDSQLVIEKIKKIEWKTENYQEKVIYVIEGMEAMAEYEKAMYDACYGRDTIVGKEYLVDTYGEKLDEFGAFMLEEAKYVRNKEK